MTGVVLSVDVKSAGVDVRADAAIGDVTVLGVDSINLPRGGGALQLPSGAVVAYVAADHEEDAVTLAGPLTEALLEGDRLLLLPIRSATQAAVQMDDGGAPVPVGVPHTMKASMPVGVRQAGEHVTVEVRDDGQFWLVDVDDRPKFLSFGNPDGVATELSDEAVRFYTVGPEGRYVATKLGSGDDRLAVGNAEGQIVAGISADGGVVAQSGVIAGDLSVGGVPLLGRLWDNSPGMPVGWLERFAAGDVATASFGEEGGPYATGTEMGYVKVGFTARAGRSYRMAFTAQAFPGTTDSAVRSRLRYTVGGVEPTVTSTLLSEDTSGTAYTGGARMTCSTAARLTVPVDTTVIVMYTFEGLGGATPRVVSGVFEVQDLGPQGTYSGGTYTTGRESTPPKTVREYVSTWTATGWAVYDESEQPAASAMQPRQYGDPDGRRDYAAIAFDGGATSGAHVGDTITTAKTGATLTKAEIFLANTSWGGGNDGVIDLGKGSAATLPLTLAPTPTVQPRVPTGAGVWIEVPVSWFSGANRVVTLGNVAGGTTGGWFMGHEDEFPPQARLTYTR